MNHWIDQGWNRVVPPSWSPHHPHVVSPITISRPAVRTASESRSVFASTPSVSLPPPVSRVSSTSSASAQLFYNPTSAVSSAPPSKQDSFRGEDEQGFSGFDRFASVYTPKWLKELPKPHQSYRHPPSPPFPPDGYTATVFPAPSLPAVDLGTVCPSVLAGPPYQDAVRPLDSALASADSTYYAVHFSRLLSHHLSAQVAEAEGAKVYMAPLSVHAMLNHTFRLHIPGIREDVPRLTMGDRLHLRGLYPKMSAPSQISVEAEVVGTVKAQGWVYVRSPALAALDVSLPTTGTPAGDLASMYQIEFAVSAAPVCTMQDAVRVLAMALKEDHPVVKSWLFPTATDMPSNEGEVLFIDKALNARQREAVKAIAIGSSPVPYLISGPPGTGKTKTLAEAVLQVVKRDPEAAVLVCAPSNTAADTIAQRLGAVLSPAELFRLNAPDRTFAEVPGELLPFCCAGRDHFDMPPFEQLMQFRVVVCGLQDSAILYRARATNVAIMEAQMDLHRKCFPAARPYAAKVHWTHLMVDEAAQASEPETLIPLSVILPKAIGPSTPSPLVVLCGDINQLGPIIASLPAREGELDVSLLERLFNRDVYADASHKANGAVAGPCTYLVENYRSIAPILMVPSSMFYNDTLRPAATDVALIPWSGLPNRDVPVLFQGCETEESWIDEGASWFNPGEIAMVAYVVQSLLKEVPGLQQSAIAVMTPWREQVWRTRSYLRKLGLGRVDVGNIETYQGKEFRVTIISCVRSRARFLPDDKRTNMGLYNERRRFNVAITRAKELLVVVGNANLLKGDPYWNGFLQIMLRNGLYRGPPVEIEMTGAYVSHIESALNRHKELDANGAGQLLAGEMARVILSDS